MHILLSLSTYLFPLHASFHPPPSPDSPLLSCLSILLFNATYPKYSYFTPPIHLPYTLPLMVTDLLYSTSTNLPTYHSSSSMSQLNLYLSTFHIAAYPPFIHTSTHPRVLVESNCGAEVSRPQLDVGSQFKEFGIERENDSKFVSTVDVTNLQHQVHEKSLHTHPAGEGKGGNQDWVNTGQRDEEMI